MANIGLLMIVLVLGLLAGAALLRPARGESGRSAHTAGMAVPGLHLTQH